MASADALLSPPTISDPANPPASLPAKRKRDDSIESSNHVNGSSDSKKVSGSAPEDSQALIRDLIDILKIHDTTPSILSRTLPEPSTSEEHQAKRQKADGSSDSASILARQSSNSYSTIEDVLADIDLAVSDIKEKLQLPEGGNKYLPPSPADTATSLNIQAFQKRAHALVQGEKSLRARTTSGDSTSTDAATEANGFTVAGSGDSKLVLTLYGNAPTPRQLFSSLQIPAIVNGESSDIVQTLREAGLPNGITTTQIVPIQPTGLIEGKKRVPTLGELFPTPATVPQLQPPKPSTVAITRSATVGWYQPAKAEPISKNDPRASSYFNQRISSGQWLDYSQFNTMVVKRKRDRAGSLVGGVRPQVEADPVESEAAKLDALFRSAYSSFAPSKDDGASVVPEGTLNRIWWQNVGEQSFERLVQNASYLEDAVIPDTESATHSAPQDEEEDKFEEAIEAMKVDDAAIDPDLESVVVAKHANEKDVDEVLEEISELLRTLNSHQRNRHLNLKTSGGQPSEPEVSIYEILKSQLTLMIASLPPYAVAKLDSDQLAELAISTKMEIRMDDYKGVMEEDEASVRTKAAAAAAAPYSAPRPVSTPQQHHPNPTATYKNQFTAPRPVPAPQHQYYGQSQTPIRPPVTNYQRPPATAQAPYNSQRPNPSAPYRPTSYGTATSYQQQPSRPQQPYTPQYNQHPQNQAYNRPAGQQYVPQSAPAAAMNTRYGVQPSYPHQAPAQNGVNYQAPNIARQSSPQKPMQNPQPQYNQAQPRPAYGTPTTSMPQDRRPYIPTSMAPQMTNGAPSPSPQPQQQTSTGYSTFMTAEQQADMMVRNRAQLAAQQQGLQHIARNAAQAGSAIPSPPKSQVNGNAVPAGL